MNKNKFLTQKGLKHGDRVRFEVENQSDWWGPLHGILNMNNEEPYIEVGGKEVITINNGYDAYINTIEKYYKPKWRYSSGAFVPV